MTSTAPGLVAVDAVVDTRTQAAPSTDAAAAVLARLVARGIRHVVVSPGSRSQALALVAAELERQDLIRLHVRIDERVAGFTALGIGRDSGVPAAVICTSGTAGANLLPAVLEADHAGVPLVLLTADRPPELRGIGANQATRQVGLYGTHVRWEQDLPVPEKTDAAGTATHTATLRESADAAIDAAMGLRGGQREGVRGPVHVNLPYREPLSGQTPAWLVQAATPDAQPVTAAPVATPAVLPRGPRTIVVAGADAGPGAEELSYTGGWPLVAEIVSGARYGRTVVGGYRQLLAEPSLGGRIERAVVYGHPTLARELVALLSRPDVEVIAVAGPGEPLNLNGATHHVSAAAAANGAHDREWLGAWMRASRAQSVDVSPPAPDVEGLASAVPHERLHALKVELDAIRAGISRDVLVDAVWRATWPHDRLMFGSSRLVRVADRILRGKKVPVHANRGLAGIDGTLSTAMGIALSSQSDGSTGTTRVLLGDLAFLHDVGGLLMGDGEPAPRMQIVVGNDGGGTIFDGLEVAETADADSIRRVLYTPQHVPLEQLATAYGLSYHHPSTRTELDQVLTAPTGGRQLIEVSLDR